MAKSYRWRPRVLASGAVIGSTIATISLTLLGAALDASGLQAAEAAQASDPPAIYTDAQAATGRQVYFRTCAICHGENLDGKVGPALTGRQFHQMVAAQKMTAPGLFHYIETQMPKSKPGSLAPADYAKVMAFILQRNGYPAGSSPLDDQGQGLEKINMAAMPKPGS